MKLLILILALACSVTARAAYFQADLPSEKSDLSLGTHIIVTGKGLEVGDQWLRAGHTQALLFKDRQLHGAIRFIGAIEDSDTVLKLKKWGYINIQVFDKVFSGSRLISLLSLPSKIASIDFIGHNGALLGFVLENYENRFFLDEVQSLGSLKNKMSENSFVRIMGCNTGWNLAPLMAQVLEVPVSGTFTFADIQKLHENGDWYYHDEGRYPPGVFLKRNEVSFNEPVSCYSDGGCMRLKPVRINYQGKHGTYKGTVPFLKFFCGPLDAQDCYRRMAVSTIYEVSTTLVEEIPTQSQFEKIMADHFCPSYLDKNKKDGCVSAVVNHVRGTKSLPVTFSTADGPTISCGFQSCQVKKDCSSGSCVMVGIAGPSPATTFVDELNAYMAGYRSLTQ